ncbi:MAG: energy transducer TonB [Flavobacteriales bacterium]
MSDQKSVQINKKHSEEFLRRLDEKPSGATNVIYQAIIVSLIIHIFILFVTHMLTEDVPRVAEQELIPVEIDMLEPEEVEKVIQEQEALQMRQGTLRNVVANENSERTNQVTNYRGMTQAQINEQVYNDLKAMEQAEFDRLQEGKPDFNSKPSGSGQSDNKTSPRNDPNQWYKDNKGSNKSYSGNVSAAFNMKGRDVYYQPLPTYRCKTSGTIVVLVTINQAGEVVDSRIDEAKSSTNECLRSESESYARKWKFDYKGDAQKKQDGTITFTFSAQ